MVYFGDGCCRFDGWSLKAHGKHTIQECLNLCNEDSNCIAADVARPAGDIYECFTFFGSNKNFHTECKELPANKCYRKILILFKKIKKPFKKTFFF